MLWCISVRLSQLQDYFTILYCLYSLALHALTMHWWTKSARIAHHNTLTLLCTRFLPKTLTYPKLRTRAPKSIPNIITLRKIQLVSKHSWQCTLSFYFAVVHAASLLCWAIPSIITLLWYTLPQFIAGLYPILTHCWGKSNLNALLSNSQFYCIDELYRILTHCWGTPCLLNLLSYSQS